MNKKLQNFYSYPCQKNLIRNFGENVMNTKKVFIGMLSLSALFVASAFATSAHVFADDTVPTTQDVAPVIDTSQSGDTTLSVPDDADKVIKDTDNQVEYQVNDAVTVDSSSGPDLTAPVTVDSQITSDDGDTTEGMTSYTANLSQAQEVDGDSLNLTDVSSSIIGDLFETKAFADTTMNPINGYVVKKDNSLSVKLSLKLKWKLTSANKVVVTKLSGGYSKSDDTVSIVGGNSSNSTHVNIGYQFRGDREIETHYTTSSSWDYNSSLTPITFAASNDVTANYFVYLHRGSSTWNAQMQAIIAGNENDE